MSAIDAMWLALIVSLVVCVAFRLGVAVGYRASRREIYAHLVRLHAAIAKFRDL